MDAYQEDHVPSELVLTSAFESCPFYLNDEDDEPFWFIETSPSINDAIENNNCPERASGISEGDSNRHSEVEGSINILTSEILKEELLFNIDVHHRSILKELANARQSFQSV